MEGGAFRERLDEVRAVLESKGYAVRIILREPATVEAVDRTQASMGTVFPGSFRELLLAHDGVELACGKADEIGIDYSGIVILGTADMLAYRRGETELSLYRQQDIVAPENRVLLRRGIPCATYDNGFNLCLLDPFRTTDGEYAVIDADHETSYEWEIIAPSFGSWLERCFEGALADGFFTYWIPGSPA
jgi:hypothetical protein